MIEWIRDDPPDLYIEWCLSVRKMLIVADDIAEAIGDAGPEGIVSLVVPSLGVAYDTSDLKGLANAMTLAARSLRDIANVLEQTVKTGFAEREFQPVEPGPEKPQ